MNNEERSALNFYLTKLKCEVEDFIEDYAEDLTPEIEEYYEGIIEEINDILIFSIEGDDLDD